MRRHGGPRFGIAGLWARKRVGMPVGCEVSVFPDRVQAPLGTVPVPLDATWFGELSRIERDLVFATISAPGPAHAAWSSPGR